MTTSRRKNASGRVADEHLLLWREPPSASIAQMVEATYLPWAEQRGRVFK
jgi:hypothetical protein